MTGPKGNNEFCFTKTLNVPLGKAKGNIGVEGKHNSLFPEGPVIKCFVILPDSKIENKSAKKKPNYFRPDEWRQRLKSRRPIFGVKLKA